jgi:pimeloyl-ACP methyl ester carboxylesterase
MCGVRSAALDVSVAPLCPPEPAPLVCSWRWASASGYGSTPVEGLLSREVIVHDAFTLVERLHQQYGVSGPYLLVGWSFGGSVILAEALEHPELTAGLVVLDSNFAVDYMKVCTASGRPERACRKGFDEDKEAKSIEKDIADRVHPLPDIPITEVSAMHLDDCSTAPGTGSASYEAAGVVLTAPDCRRWQRRSLRRTSGTGGSSVLRSRSSGSRRPTTG